MCVWIKILCTGRGGTCQVEFKREIHENCGGDCDEDSATSWVVEREGTCTSCVYPSPPDSDWWSSVCSYICIVFWSCAVLWQFYVVASTNTKYILFCNDIQYKMYVHSLAFFNNSIFMKYPSWIIQPSLPFHSYPSYWRDAIPADLKHAQSTWFTSDVDWEDVFTGIIVDELFWRGFRAKEACAAARSG